MTDISIAATIGNEKYEHPFINAAGVYDETAAQMNEILDSQAGGVTTKSATLVSRPGNPLPRYFNTELEINSMGLPNQGLDYYLIILRKLILISQSTYQFQELQWLII